MEHNQRVAGEDERGGLNDWNFLNELNACEGLLPSLRKARTLLPSSTSRCGIRDNLG